MKKQIFYYSIFAICYFGITSSLIAQERQKIRYPEGITEEIVKKHVLNPSYIIGVSGEDNKNEKQIKLSEQTPNFNLNLSYHLNVTLFGQTIHKYLKDSVTGYVLQLAQNGNIIYSLKWNWGQTPADASQGWEYDTRMHVASVSKYLTALGLMKALKLKGISYDTKIINYLPSYWTKGPNINQISFRNLLTQTSGFNTGTWHSDYNFMKDKVQQGVSNVGVYDYENMNFGLCRILIPVIMGYVDKDMSTGDASWDALAWDVTTIGFYKQFMQEKIFTPSGVPLADFKPTFYTKTAFAYKFPHNNQDGWNSGDLATVSGGAGWRLSISEVLKVMDHARRKGDILSSSDVQYGLDNKFGIDQIISTAAGNLYNKNGAWNNNGSTEQCVAYFLPNNMELVVFINSPLGAGTYSLRKLISDVFKNSLTL